MGLSKKSLFLACCSHLKSHTLMRLSPAPRDCTAQKAVGNHFGCRQGFQFNSRMNSGVEAWGPVWLQMGCKFLSTFLFGPSCLSLCFCISWNAFDWNEIHWPEALKRKISWLVTSWLPSKKVFSLILEMVWGLKLTALGYKPAHRFVWFDRCCA